MKTINELIAEQKNVSTQFKDAINNQYIKIIEAMVAEGESTMGIENFIDDLRSSDLNILIRHKWEYWTNCTFRKLIKGTWCFISCLNTQFETYTDSRNNPPTFISPESFYYIDSAVTYVTLVANDNYRYKNRLD